MDRRIPIQPYANRLSARNRLLRALWNTCYLFLMRFTPSWTLHGYRCVLLRLFGAQIGRGCRIHPRCRIWAPWNLRLGDFVSLAADVDCYTVDVISLASKVSVSQRSFLCTASHDIRSLDRPLVHGPIAVEAHAWIAAEAFVGPGVVIGEGSVIAARSVVTKAVAPWTVVAGNPGAAIKARKLSSEVPESTPCAAERPSDAASQ